MTLLQSARFSAILPAIFLFGWIQAGTVYAGSPPSPVDRGLTGSQYIGTDGTLDLEAIRASGHQGTVDLTGLRAMIGPDGLSIRAAEDRTLGERAEGDENWWDGFGSPGVDWTVNALVVYGGELIVGGAFTLAGGTPVNRIARWNGATWSPLGTGVNETVLALHVHNGVLIVGGRFTEAGGGPAERIAQWNGASWSPIGSGMNSDVISLATFGTQLIAGGVFTIAGGVSAKRIAQWNGVAWSALGTGADEGGVAALQTFGPDLIVAGSFDHIGGIEANSIAKWNGTTWSNVGAWPHYEINDLEVFQGEVYASGWGNLNRWDGTNWVGVGYPPGVYPGMMALYDGKLIVCGGGGKWIYAWDGSSWTPLGEGLSWERAGGLAVFDGHLYVGGYFFSAGGRNILHIASWDGVDWSPVGGPAGEGVGYIDALTVYQGDLYAGGTFSAAGGTPANNIARWDGVAWHALGEGVTAFSGGRVYSLIVHDGSLVVGGSFDRAGGQWIPHLARWNGSGWSSFGGETHGGPPRAFAVYDGDLIAAGNFYQIGGVSANGIARWDGYQWHTLGTGIESCEVRALTVYENKLIAGGCFEQVGGVAASRLAQWDGMSWSAMGSGVNGDVNALAVFRGDLIAGGYFDPEGGGDFDLARWNGASWELYAGGAYGGILTLSVIDTDLYVGGNFFVIGGLQIRGIARYDGTGWSPLGSGIPFGVRALAQLEDTENNNLFVGGEFTRLDNGTYSVGIARWRIGPSSHPRILSVTDIGNDQGRQVRLRWSRSRFDAPGQPVTITGYAIFREQEEFAGASPEVERDQAGLRLDGWDYITTVPAFGDSVYQCVAPTLCDSTIVDGLCLSNFMVRATTASPFEFYDSTPLSGYSVDNLAPSIPGNFRFVQPQRLAWDECPDGDFDYFTIYGSASELLDETAVVIGHTTLPGFDVTDHAHPYYHVSSTDFAGNEGLAASLANPADVSDGPAIPRSLALDIVGRNPTVRDATLRYGLPRATRVGIDIYDASGRLMRKLVDSDRAAGWHGTVWDGTTDAGSMAPSGTYFARLTAAGRTCEQRITVLR